MQKIKTQYLYILITIWLLPVAYTNSAEKSNPCAKIIEELNPVESSYIALVKQALSEGLLSADDITKQNPFSDKIPQANNLAYKNNLNALINSGHIDFQKLMQPLSALATDHQQKKIVKQAYSDKSLKVFSPQIAKTLYKGTDFYGPTDYAQLISGQEVIISGSHGSQILMVDLNDNNVERLELPGLAAVTMPQYIKTKGNEEYIVFRSGPVMRKYIHNYQDYNLFYLNLKNPGKTKKINFAPAGSFCIKDDFIHVNTFGHFRSKDGRVTLAAIAHCHGHPAAHLLPQFMQHNLGQ